MLHYAAMTQSVSAMESSDNISMSANVGYGVLSSSTHHKDHPTEGSSFEDGYENDGFTHHTFKW